MDLANMHFAQHILFTPQDPTRIYFEPNLIIRFFPQFGIYSIKSLDPGASLRGQGGDFNPNLFCSTILREGHINQYYQIQPNFFDYACFIHLTGSWK